MFWHRKRALDEPETFPETFYQDERLGAQMAMTRVWQGCAVVGWLFAVVPWVVIGAVASRSQIVPHVVEVYPEGQVLYRGAVETSEIKDDWVDAQVREWIYRVRRRTDDPVLDREMRALALKMTSGAATKKLEAYLERLIAVETKDGPGNRMRVMVQGLTVVRERPDQLRITWREEWTPTIGTQAHVIRLDGVFRLEHRLKKPGLLGQFKIQAKDLERSPLGVFVTFFDWDEVSETPVASVQTRREP